MFGVAVGHIQTDHVDLELFQAEWGYKLSITWPLAEGLGCLFKAYVLKVSSLYSGRVRFVMESSRQKSNKLSSHLRISW